MHLKHKHQPFGHYHTDNWFKKDCGEKEQGLTFYGAKTHSQEEKGHICSIPHVLHDLVSKGKVPLMQLIPDQFSKVKFKTQKLHIRCRFTRYNEK